MSHKIWVKFTLILGYTSYETSTPRLVNKANPTPTHTPQKITTKTKHNYTIFFSKLHLFFKWNFMNRPYFNIFHFYTKCLYQSCVNDITIIIYHYECIIFQQTTEMASTSQSSLPLRISLTVLSIQIPVLQIL